MRPIPLAPPPRPDDSPARWVDTLWRQWLDPVELAFEDLAVQQELEQLRRRRDRATGRPDAIHDA